MNQHEPIPEEMEELFPLDALDGPAAPLEAAEAEALIAGALDAWQADLPPSPDGGPAPEPGRGPLWVAAGLGLALIVSGIAALGFDPAESSGPVREPPEATAPFPTAAAELAPIDDTSLVPHPEDTPASPAEVPASAPVDPVESPEVAEVAGQAPVDDGAAPSPRPRRPRSAAATEDLLRRANGLRGERRWREAERTYMQVVSGAPRGRAAYVARIAAASLRLDKLNDPRGALALFRAARRQQPTGALDAEARRGVAGSYRRLGNGAAEARELERLVTAHPDSPFARSARRRLDELSSAE